MKSETWDSRREAETMTALQRDPYSDMVLHGSLRAENLRSIPVRSIRVGSLEHIVNELCSGRPLFSKIL